MTADARLIAGRYRLEQQIGAGAMGVVWRAHDIRLDRSVAVKQLLMQPGLGESETDAATARAMREGRIAARLQHPHAISVYDVALDHIDSSSTGGRAVPWLIMEYLPSRSLAAVLAERGTLPPRDVARIGRQVAAALAAAHRAGIVHRDVKPGNVLLGDDGIVKITDFGISRASWEAAVTRTGVVAGTPAYFAPEVARGEPRDPAADVFSLGSTLYAAVEGAPPFGLDDNTLALLRTVAEGQIRPPQQAGPLSALLMKMLRDDPRRRPSMPDAVVALGLVANGGSRARPVRRASPAVTPTAVDLPAIPVQQIPLRERTKQSTPVRAGAVPVRQISLQAGTKQTDLVLDTPVPSDPPRSAAPDAEGQAHPGQRRTLLLGVSAGLVIVLAVVAFALAGNDGSQVQGGRGSSASTSVTQPAAPPPATLPGPAVLEQAVRNYYGLLPQNTAAAWEILAAPQRARSNGFAAYVAFWNGISAVSVRGPVTVQGNTVLVDLQFEPKDRGPTLERYQLTMGTAPDGRVLIESASLRSSSAADPDLQSRGGGR
ncbi:MAG TPA: serine/threonine-protein kinase [Pseudonocardiaceae bacterium]